MKKRVVISSAQKLNKTGLHPRNAHRGGYDFAALMKSDQALAPHVKLNEHGVESIDFSDPVAVKTLNRSLLKHHYGIDGWDIPDGFLCPPIPGRVDYIHYVAELLGVSEPGEINDTVLSDGVSRSVRMLDIGTGANGIYALLACKVYGWSCTASDIDATSLDNVAAIIARDPGLEERIKLRLQSDNSHIFEGVIKEGEFYDLSVCNPPFHASLEEALKVSQKKVANLNRNRHKRSAEGVGDGAVDPSLSQPETVLNFGGQKAELWCKGGEIRFLRKMLKESKRFATQCKWFTSLVSKSENVKPSLKILAKLGAVEVKEINMQQGNKLTRLLAWRF
ncbi:MAG: 23S rRNA (adenine1618-N6)-methyltransferase [Cryomorphaceae bacterium]|jgi:23S rRNA (adenine1618-N6)-methyltransferase